MRKFNNLILAGLLLAAINTVKAQSIISDIYFPGIAGVRFPVQKQRFNYSKGFSVNTAIEYRPKGNSAFFYRFNFDGASANYTGNKGNLPVNVINGTIHSNSFITGAGYRYKRNPIGLYILLQPGVRVNSFNRVSGTSADGYMVDQLSVHKFEIKYSAGVEYYLAEHFALVFEPAYYQNTLGQNKGLASINQLSLNIGFTTTLF